MKQLLRANRKEGARGRSRRRPSARVVSGAFRRYVVITASFKPLADRGRLGAAGAAVGDGRGDQEWDRLKELIAAWDNHKVDTAEAAADASHFGVTLILALLGAALSIAVAVAILLARRTTRAVREIAVAAKAIAQGDIDQRVDVRSRDELGEMARDFDSMIEYLRSTVAIAETIAEGGR